MASVATLSQKQNKKNKKNLLYNGEYCVFISELFPLFKSLSNCLREYGLIKK